MSPDIFLAHAICPHVLKRHAAMGWKKRKALRVWLEFDGFQTGDRQLTRSRMHRPVCSHELFQLRSNSGFGACRSSGAGNAAEIVESLRISMLRSADDADVIGKRLRQIRAVKLLDEVRLAEGQVLTDICKIVEMDRFYAESDADLRKRFIAFAES